MDANTLKHFKRRLFEKGSDKICPSAIAKQAKADTANKRVLSPEQEKEADDFCQPFIEYLNTGNAQWPNQEDE